VGGGRGGREFHEFFSITFFSHHTGTCNNILLYIHNMHQYDIVLFPLFFYTVAIVGIGGSGVQHVERIMGSLYDALTSFLGEIYVVDFFSFFSFLPLHPQDFLPIPLLLFFLFFFFPLLFSRFHCWQRLKYNDICKVRSAKLELQQVARYYVGSSAEVTYLHHTVQGPPINPECHCGAVMIAHRVLDNHTNLEDLPEDPSSLTTTHAFRIPSSCERAPTFSHAPPGVSEPTASTPFSPNHPVTDLSPLPTTLLSHERASDRITQVPSTLPIIANQSPQAGFNLFYVSTLANSDL